MKRQHATRPGGAPLLDRQAFKTAVFARDGGRCVICGAAAVDAHHILDRKLFADGGYYLGNGSSLCGDCHIEAEKTLICVETIRAACGIVDPVLPAGFLASGIYDKWGNRKSGEGRWRPGPLFGDDGARKILAAAGLLYSGIFEMT